MGLMDLIFKIFDSNPSSWLKNLYVSIEKLLHFLLSLLGGLFGLIASQVAEKLSEREVCFLKEMTQLTA
jgi:hypothetical protein